jgi:2-oxo-3-hexenedioate decarboxylase
MDSVAEASDIAAIARDAVAAITDHRQIPTFSARRGGLTLADSYRVTPHLRAAFEARGETIVGRKIGFTNREMWKVYGAKAPVWGYVTNRTTHELARVPAKRIADFVAPRIEPEIMFGMKSAPAPDMDEPALLDCIDWVSFGYEIVQSIFPGWKFQASDTVAANGVHGALLIGARHAIAPRKAQWLREFATFQVELACAGKPTQHGGGALVLDSPLLALRHLVQLLADDPHNPPIGAGEIISTGTLTLAMAVSAGETWTAKASGIPLEDISLRFE